MMKKPVFYLLLLLFALAGLALAAYSTPKGLGLVNDSVAYINGARGLVEGSGYGRLAGDGTIKPITHFPPGFSVVLALFGLVGLDAIPAARIVNLALFAVNIVLAGLLAQRVTRSMWAALLAAGMFALSESLLRVHAYALSEPLFLTLTMGCLLVLTRSFDLLEQNTGTAGWLMAFVAAGDLAGLSYLARYVGLAILAAAVPVLAFFPAGWKQKIQRTAVFLGSALVWVLVWSVRNAALVGSATNRTLGYHAITTQNAWNGVANLRMFLLPSRIQVLNLLPNAVWAVLTVLLFLGLAVGLILGLRAALRGAREDFPAWLVGLHLAAYLAVILLSMTFVDASTTFEDRILAPVYADGIILLAWLFTRVDRLTRSAYRPALAVVALLLLLSFADDARKTSLDLRLDGQGFASSYWTNSQTMNHARRLPDMTIYSDRISALTLLADRQAIALLGPVDPVTQEPRPNFEKTQAIIRASVLEGRALLVVFSTEELPDSDWYQKLVQDLPVIALYPDGSIYGRLDE